MSFEGLNVAVVGATGAVGVEFLRLIEQRNFPYSKLTLLASARSAGKVMTCNGQDITVEELTEDSFADVDLALFSAGGSITKTFAPIARDAGALVVDNSSAFRMTDGVPLVVPEINGELAEAYRGEGDAHLKPGIIANPNCSTIIMLVPLQPLHEQFGVKRIVASTYQAVSGAGAAGMDELVEQTKAIVQGVDRERQMFGEPCAHNVFSHDSDVDPVTGRNVEEQKMINETRKIWGDDSIKVAPTCMRVPVLRAHTESICVTLEKPATEAQVREAIAGGEGIEVIDDREANSFPTPLKASDKDPVFVGRIRLDESQDYQVVDGGQGDAREGVGFELLVVGDQIRKGAALNALQIAERALGVGVGA